MSNKKTYLCKEITPAEWVKMSYAGRYALAWDTLNPHIVDELDNLMGFKDGSWCTEDGSRYNHVGIPINTLREGTLYDCHKTDGVIQHLKLRYHGGMLVSDSYVGGSDPEGMIFDVSAFSFIVEELPDSMANPSPEKTDNGTDSVCTSVSFALKYIPSAEEALRTYRRCEILFEDAYTKVGEAIRSAMSNGERSVTVNIKGNPNFTDAVVSMAIKLGYASSKTLAGDFDSDIFISW